MPYIATVDGQQVNALALERSTFDGLKGKSVLCPACNEEMFTKHSKAPLCTPYFAHYRKTAYCPTSNMSPEHLAMQALVDKTIAQCDGWQSVIEYVGEGWRGDVVAINAESGKIISFEVQLSRMSYDKAMDRVDRHKTSGVESVIWLLGKEFYWQSQVSSARFTVEKDWDPMQGISVIYRGLQNPYEEYSDEKTYQTVDVGVFVEKILANELIPTHPEGVAITRNGELTTLFDEDSVYQDFWIFETCDQVQSKIRETAYIKAQEEYSRRSAEYFEQYYAEKAAEREAEGRRRDESIEQWRQKKRDIKAKLAEIVPGIYFDDTPYDTTAKGDLALCPNGQYIVIQPVRKRINGYSSQGLICDNRIPILFMHEYEKDKLLHKFPFRQSVYCLVDIVNDKSVLDDVLTAQERHAKPMFSPFKLY